MNTLHNTQMQSEPPYTYTITDSPTILEPAYIRSIDYIKDVFGRTILCIYDNQPTDNFKKGNNTKKSYYHKQRITKHYPTQNKEDTTDDNYSDSENESESENQKNQQQQETTTTINENQQQNQIETQD